MSTSRGTVIQSNITWESSCRNIAAEDKIQYSRRLLGPKKFLTNSPASNFFDLFSRIRAGPRFVRCMYSILQTVLPNYALLNMILLKGSRQGVRGKMYGLRKLRCARTCRLSIPASRSDGPDFSKFFHPVLAHGFTVCRKLIGFCR